MGARTSPLSGEMPAPPPGDAGRRLTYPALIGPPVALAGDVLARSIAETARADDEALEAFRVGLVAFARTGRDAHRVPPLELDDLSVGPKGTDRFGAMPRGRA